MHIWITSILDLFPEFRSRKAKGLRLQDMRGIPTYSRLAVLLSKTEQRRLEGFKVAHAALLYLAAHTMTRTVLDWYATCPIRTLEELPQWPSGKPYLPKEMTGKPLYFNLSHSWPLAVLAITRVAECGVDVEVADEELPWLEMSRHAMHPKEFQAVVNAPHPDRAFLKTWTLKEAVAKAVGLGLAWDFSSFSIQKNGAIAENGVVRNDLCVLPVPCPELRGSRNIFMAVGCKVAPDEMPAVKVHAFDIAQCPLNHNRQVIL